MNRDKGGMNPLLLLQPDEQESTGEQEPVGFIILSDENGEVKVAQLPDLAFPDGPEEMMLMASMVQLGMAQQIYDESRNEEANTESTSTVGLRQDSRPN